MNGWNEAPGNRPTLPTGPNPVSPGSIQGGLAALSAEARDKAAKAAGLVIVLPGPRELFVDLDSEEALEECKGLVTTAVLSGIPIGGWDFWPSRQRGHYHAVIETLFDLTPAKRIAYQASLGSDRRRELLSMARLQMGIEPTVFFETPQRAAEMAAQPRKA